MADNGETAQAEDRAELNMSEDVDEKMAVSKKGLSDSFENTETGVSKALAVDDVKASYADGDLEKDKIGKAAETQAQVLNEALDPASESTSEEKVGVEKPSPKPNDPPSPELLSEIVSGCYAKYSSLGKAGAPRPGQWTVLSCMVVVRAGEWRLVSLATGTKCLGGEVRLAMEVEGSLLHDSHAEVLARRGLLLWLLEQVEAGGGEVVEAREGGWGLREGWQVLLLTTQPPCGDATIAPKEQEEDEGQDSEGPDAKKSKVEDIHRTGARAVEGELCDPEGAGAGYHTVGVLRTKPGRGPRTLSLSCSDKILKWNMLGLQGALLSHLYPAPIHLASVLVCGAGYSEEALHRALSARAGEFTVNSPSLHHVDMQWEGGVKGGALQPSPDSLVWVSGVEGGHREALTEGRRQGWPSRKLQEPRAWSALCRRRLFPRVRALLPSLRPLFTSYCSAKQSSPQYQLRGRYKGSILERWPAKPPQDFSVAPSWREERARLAASDREGRRAGYWCGEDYTALEDIATWAVEERKELSGSEKTKLEDETLQDLELNDVPGLGDLAQKVSIHVGDITKLEVDAIVNAANSSLLGGGGVDGAIHRAAGPLLLKENRSLGGCREGEARTSCGYRLPARFVLSTVGPQGEQPEVLEACYTSCLRLLLKHELRSVAFPCISTGIYGYPNSSACGVALRSVRRFLEEHGERVDRVVFCLFLQKDVTLYRERMAVVFPGGRKNGQEGGKDEETLETED